MQRVLQAGARASSRACSARRLECAAEDSAIGYNTMGCPCPSSPSRSPAMPSEALHIGRISDTGQQLFQPASAGARRQAHASAAQAAGACQQQQQLFSFRQASNERPASHAKQQEPTADVRSAIVARLVRRYHHYQPESLRPIQHFFKVSCDLLLLNAKTSLCSVCARSLSIFLST